jgi:hypothetical protein
VNDGNFNYSFNNFWNFFDHFDNSFNNLLNFFNSISFNNFLNNNLHFKWSINCVCSLNHFFYNLRYFNDSLFPLNNNHRFFYYSLNDLISHFDVVDCFRHIDILFLNNNLLHNFFNLNNFWYSNYFLNNFLHNHWNLDYLLDDFFDRYDSISPSFNFSNLNADMIECL